MTNPNPKLAVLILQYNSTDLTIQLLESIEQFEGYNLSNYRFVLMDNNSQEPRRTEIEHRFPWLSFVSYEDNLGFGRAHNRIMEEIYDEWILLLNNDCILLNNAITRTLQDAQKVQADFATCAVLNQDMTDQTNFSTLPTPLRKVLLNLTGITRLLWYIRRKISVTRVGYVNGAFLLIRRAVIPKDQLFDDRYFMYTEDLDLMFRLAKQQAKGYRLASGRVIHLGGKSAARKWTGQEINDVKELQAKECMQRHFPSWQVNFMVGIYRIVLRHQS